MKTIATCFVLMALAVPSLLAQEGEPSMREKQRREPGQVQTLFDPSTGSGGYGALSIGYTQINNRDAILMGGRGEWVIGHGFGLGLAGYGFVNDPIYDPIDDLNYSLAGGYGGLLVEPIAGGLKPVHFSFPVIIGIGGVALIENYGWDYWDYPHSGSAEHDIFFVFEPGVELEFNVTRFFRTAAAVSYRFTSDVEISGMEQNVLKGLNFKLGFKFGKF